MQNYFFGIRHNVQLKSKVFQIFENIFEILYNIDAQLYII